mgnify:FL=1
MKKFSYIALTLAILFINSNVYAAEARVSSTSFSQALQTAKSKGNFAALKSVKYDVKEKVYNITYLVKDGSVKTIKISQVNGNEVK